MNPDPGVGGRSGPLRIVYAGARGAGKSANLRSMLRRIENPDVEGLIRVRDASFDNALMDFLLLDLTPRYAATIGVVLLTLSPNLHREMSRDIIAGGVDGLVLVVDADVSAFPANMKAAQAVSAALALSDSLSRRVGPVVIQYNRRPGGHGLPDAYLQERLNPRGYPAITAWADAGRGVLQTFRTVLSAALTARHGSPIGYAG